MLIAIDPGQHTGLAFRLDNNEWATLLADKLPDADERLALVLTTLQDYMSTGACNMLIIEDFKTMGYVSRYGLETVELVGAIKCLCYVYHVNMIRQSPTQRLPFERQATALLKARGKALGIPISDHEISALSHLLRYEYTVEQAARPVQAGTHEHSGPIAFTIKERKA